MERVVASEGGTLEEAMTVRRDDAVLTSEALM